MFIFHVINYQFYKNSGVIFKHIQDLQLQGTTAHKRNPNTYPFI